MGFLKPSRPAPVQVAQVAKEQPVAPTITATDPEVQEAVRKEKELSRLRKGRKSTLLTGPAGLGDTAPTEKKTLLGQ